VSARGILRNVDGGDVAFFCPGCERWHVINAARWHFDGNYDRPTFSPSIVITTNAIADDDGAVLLAASKCHSFVKDGHIQFLGDCTHAMAGKTVPLQEHKT
jgi:Family of unknown function (DUF6527)